MAFFALVVVGFGVRCWLLARQIRAVKAHRDAVPSPFAAVIGLSEHRKAADYTRAKARLAMASAAVDAILTLAFTLGGGLRVLDALCVRSGWPQPWEGALLIGCVAGISALVDLPLTLWGTFRLEARFGFNRMTLRVFFTDAAKSAALGVLVGTPIVLGALVLMERAGRLWWMWAWAGWLALIMLMTWAWPTLIAPLFNRFSPLADAALRTRIETLLQRCGFQSSGVFVVDGSRRSAHGNAYFTGIGRNKRIVFFDTLLERLSPAGVESVLAHELGHFRLHHIRQRLAVMMLVSFAGLALLGFLAARPELYASLGGVRPSAHMALVLFMLAAPVVTFFATPIGSAWSRRHEFAADGFAAQHSSAQDLVTALVTLYRENAATLTPDPVYSAFFYSHPPAMERIARLEAR